MKKTKLPEGALKPYRDPFKVRFKNYFGAFKSPFTVIMFLLLLFQSATVLFALYWMFATSLKSQINFGIDNVGLPNPFRFDNYVKAFSYLYVQIKADGGYRDAYLPELLWNSILFSVSHTVMVVGTHAICAYVLAKFKKFRLVRLVTSIIVVLMVVPVVTSLGASLDWNKTVGVYDNFPMIVYSCIAIFDSGTLIYIGAFDGVSDSYIEAAKIDGASNFRCLFTIGIPLIRTVLMVMIVTNFITFWNNYMTPYIYMPSTPTLSVALWYFSQSNTNAISSEPMQMAAAALVCIPCLVLFFAVRDKMIGNLTMGGIKG